MKRVENCGALAVNMMPIVFGDPGTVPPELRGYLPLIERCEMRQGSTVYLSVHESWVRAGETQRRPGVHTEATCGIGWGGFPWGGSGGVWMWSTDGRCRVWEGDEAAPGDVDGHGGLLRDPRGPGRVLSPGELVCMSDRTPHEALPVERGGWRRWFRLVSEGIGGWWVEHSTPNPLGLLPQAPLLHGNKFEVSP